MCGWLEATVTCCTVRQWEVRNTHQDVFKHPIPRSSSQTSASFNSHPAYLEGHRQMTFSV